MTCSTFVSRFFLAKQHTFLIVSYARLCQFDWNVDRKKSTKFWTLRRDTIPKTTEQGSTCRTELGRREFCNFYPDPDQSSSMSFQFCPCIDFLYPLLRVHSSFPFLRHQEHKYQSKGIQNAQGIQNLIFWTTFSVSLKLTFLPASLL